MPYRFRDNTKTKHLMEMVLYTGGFKHRNLSFLTDNAVTLQEAKKAQAKYQQAERRLRQDGYLRKDYIDKMWIVRKRAGSFTGNLDILDKTYEKAAEKWWKHGTDDKTSSRRAYKLSATALFMDGIIPLFPWEKPKLGSESNATGDYFYAPREIYEHGDWSKAGSGNLAWSRITGIISRRAVYAIGGDDKIVGFSQEGKASALISAILNHTLTFSNELSLPEAIFLTLDDKAVKSYVDTTMETLIDCFKTVYAIPMTFCGKRLLKLLLSNPEALKGLVDLPGKNPGNIECDAITDDDTYILEWFVPDINRLKRFCALSQLLDGKFIICCFDFQAESLSPLKGMEIQSYPFEEFIREAL